MLFTKLLKSHHLASLPLRRHASAAMAMPASPHVDDSATPASTTGNPSSEPRGVKRILKTGVDEKALDAPPPDGQNRRFSSKILGIVDQISSLSLLEVADLNQALKKRLNIPDAPMMSYAVAPPAGSSKKADEDEDENGPAIVTKTSFTVKLLKFEDGKKIDLIKEIKSLMTGMNLVQAKKYVESLPQVVKADIGKDEAEKLKERLTKIGAQCEVV